MPSSPILNSHKPPEWSQVMVNVQEHRRNQKAGGFFGLAQNSTFPVTLVPHLTVPQALFWQQKCPKYSGSWFLFSGQVGAPVLPSWHVQRQLTFHSHWVWNVLHKPPPQLIFLLLWLQGERLEGLVFKSQIFFFFHMKPEGVSGQIVVEPTLLLNFKSGSEKPDMQGGVCAGRCTEDVFAGKGQAEVCRSRGRREGMPSLSRAPLCTFSQGWRAVKLQLIISS